MMKLFNNPKSKVLVAKFPDIYTGKCVVTYRNLDDSICEPNYVFYDKMKQSSSENYFENEAGKRFYIRYDELKKLLQEVSNGKVRLDNGWFHGFWTFNKKGESLSLSVYKE